MSKSSIAIIGSEGSGKTVFIASLAHALQNSPIGQTRLVPKDIRTARYCAAIVDQLNAGQWPASTSAGVIESLAWAWIEPCGKHHHLQVIDSAGQDFRQIYEGGDLSSHQQKLKDVFHSAKLVVLLVNLNDAIACCGLSETRRIDVEFVPAMALRQLKESGVTMLILLSQSDLYRDHLESENLTSPNEALKRYLPLLGNAAAETNTPVSFISSVESQVMLLSGNAEIRPFRVNIKGMTIVASNIQEALSVQIRKQLYNDQLSEVKKPQERIEKQKHWDASYNQFLTICGIVSCFTFWICHRHMHGETYVFFGALLLIISFSVAAMFTNIFCGQRPK